MPATLFLQIFSYNPISSSSYSSTNKNSLNNSQNPSFSTNKNTEFTVFSDPISQSNATIKVPTAPWMKGPLLLQPHELLNLSKPRNKNPSKNANIEKSDEALTAKESGVRGKKAMAKIVKSIDKLQQNQDSVNTQVNSDGFEIGESLAQLEGDEDLSADKKLLPWVREERVVYRRMKKEKVVTKAELSLDKELLEKLRNEAARMRKWVNVKKAGVTQRVVDEIRHAWRRSELAMVKFDLPLRRNMDRAREIVEVWFPYAAIVLFGFLMLVKYIYCHGEFHKIC